MMDYTYTVTDIQRFCMHDGPGIRTTVFLQGCPLRCFWCHNPETAGNAAPLLYRAGKCLGCEACGVCPYGVHTFADGHRIDRTACVGCGACVEACPTGALALSARSMTAEEILAQVERDVAFYGDSGGLTLSGGEPLLHPQATIALLAAAKARGLHTAVETCGFFPTEQVLPLCAVTDCLLWDIKDTDEARHARHTGVNPRQIRENLRLADTTGVPIILRCVLLKGVNLEEAHLRAVGELFRSLRHGVRVDLLPCHPLGGAKAQALGQTPPSLDAHIPSPVDMAWANAILNEYRK